MKIKSIDHGFVKVQIEINNTCNMKCTFCGLTTSKLPKRNMDKDVVFKVLNSLSHYEGMTYVTFPQFGEPLLNKNVWEYIDKCRSLNLKSQLVTNGLLLTEKNINALYEHRPDSLQISLQVLDEKKHNLVRKSKESFMTYVDRISTCLARFIDNPPGIEEIHTDVCFEWDNFLGIIGLKRLLLHKLRISELGDPSMDSPTIRELRGDLICFLKRIEKSSHGFQLSLDKLDEHIEEFYSKPSVTKRFVAYDFGNNHKIFYKPFVNGNKRVQYYPVIRGGGCPIPIIGILANGSVSLCLQDNNGFATIGNIVEEDFSSILERNRRRIKELRTGENMFAACSRCLGSPTRGGAFLKSCVNEIKFLMSRKKW